MTEEHGIAIYRRCRQCGKRFYIGPLIEKWTYKRKLNDGNTAWFCTWSCYSEYQKTHKDNYNDEKPMRKRMRKQDDEMP